MNHPAARLIGLLLGLLTAAPAFAQALVFAWMDNPGATVEDLVASLARADVVLTSQSLEERFTPQSAEFFRLLLCKAFDKARRRSLERAAEVAVSFFPLPWIADELRIARGLFGDDPWPYGVAANRRTLDAFLQYAHEQGVCRRRLTSEELFPAEVLETFKI